MKELKNIYKKIIKNIKYSQRRSEFYTNKKRKKKSQLEKRNKIYLIKKNLGSSQLNKKLDYKKINLFVN